MSSWRKKKNPIKPQNHQDSGKIAKPSRGGFVTLPDTHARSRPYVMRLEVTVIFSSRVAAAEERQGVESHNHIPVNGGVWCEGVAATGLPDTEGSDGGISDVVMLVKWPVNLRVTVCIKLKEVVRDDGILTFMQWTIAIVVSEWRNTEKERINERSREYDVLPKLTNEIARK